MTTATAEDLTSPDLSWAESDLPSPVEEPAPNDNTQFINPPANSCPTCGEEVVKAPGQRGRTPKYHPECKPVRGGKVEGPRPVRVAAKERLAAEQVEEVLDRARGGLAKAVMLMSLADPYDAFVLHVNSKDLLEHCRVLLMRFPRLRETSADASMVASIFGLAVTVLSIGLPIAAHHNLLPSKKLAQVFLNLPQLMLRMQERLAAMDPNAVGEDLFDQVKAQARKAQETRMHAQSAESVHATNSR